MKELVNEKMPKKLHMGNNWNFRKEDGTLLSKSENFKVIWDFFDGAALVKRANGFWNYITPEGNFVSEHEDFLLGYKFINGISCVVRKNGMMNYLLLKENF